MKIEYKASVARDLKRLGPEAARRVLDRLEKELKAGAKKGEPFRGEFAGLYRLRVGEYRLIYARTEEGFLVLRIGHRGEVYRP